MDAWLERFKRLKLGGLNDWLISKLRPNESAEFSVSDETWQKLVGGNFELRC